MSAVSKRPIPHNIIKYTVELPTFTTASHCDKRSNNPASLNANDKASPPPNISNTPHDSFSVSDHSNKPTERSFGIAESLGIKKRDNPNAKAIQVSLKAGIFNAEEIGDWKIQQSTAPAKTNKTLRSVFEIPPISFRRRCNSS